MEDLFSVVPKEREIPVNHPKTGELLVTVMLMSVDDPRLKQAQRRLTDARIERERRGKTMKSEEMETSIIQLLAKTVTGWRWESEEFGIDGNKPEYSPRLVIDLMTKLPWFFEQINDAAGDTKAFF